MTKKKKSLSRKSIIRLIVLGIVLFAGTGLAGGIQIYHQNLGSFKNTAESYAYMVTYEVSYSDIDAILENEEAICAIDKRAGFLAKQETDDNSVNKQVMERISAEFGKEQADAYNAWVTIAKFIVGFGNICNNMESAYVVIPTEEDLIYLWNSKLSEDNEIIPFEHFPYTGDEKEHIMAVMSGEREMDFFTATLEDGEKIGTFLTPVFNQNTEVCAVAAVDISISMITSMCFKLLCNIGIAIFLIMLISITIYHYVVRKQIIAPIVTLTDAADGLVRNLREEGCKPFSVNVHTGDEIDVLARSFEQMDEKLLEYIRENAAITAEKERIGTELALASRIQEDMLPSTFPPFPDRSEIDLYATMKPAKDVGGDFYDFFKISENVVGLVMADVSGKGIPAALFMMMSKIMVQNFALTLGGPGEVLQKVNDQICTNPVEEMFVTVWLGFLDLRTGLLTAANAGHEYPILMAPGGEFELLKDRHGLVVGGMEGYPYQEYQLKLEAGSRLFLYTDGLPEATDTENRMFGIERTLKSLNEVKNGTPREVLEHVTKSVADFVGSAPQFDDTTMLCLDYRGC